MHEGMQLQTQAIPGPTPVLSAASIVNPTKHHMTNRYGWNMLKHGHIWVAWIWFRRIIYLLLPHLHTEQEPMSTVGCSGFYTGHIQLPAGVFLDVKVMLVMVFSNSNVFVGGCRRLARLALNLNSVPYSPYSVRSVWSLSIAVALRPIRRRPLYTVHYCTILYLLRPMAQTVLFTNYSHHPPDVFASAIRLRIMYLRLPWLSMVFLQAHLLFIGHSISVKGGRQDELTCAPLSNQELYSSVKVSIGDPAQTFDLVADTGSDSCIVKDCTCNQCPAEWGGCFNGRKSSKSFKLPMFLVSGHEMRIELTKQKQPQLFQLLAGKSKQSKQPQYCSGKAWQRNAKLHFSTGPQVRNMRELLMWSHV